MKFNSPRFPCPFCNMEMSLYIDALLADALDFNPNLDVVDYALHHNYELEFGCENVHFVTIEREYIILTYDHSSYIRYDTRCTNNWYCVMKYNMIVADNESNPLEYFNSLLLFT